jgi:hypothetical protein
MTEENKTRCEIMTLLTDIARSAYFDYRNTVRGNVFMHACFILQNEWKLEPFEVIPPRGNSNWGCGRWTDGSGGTR